MLIGFLTGVGIQVAMGQLHGVLGVSDGSGTTIQKFVTTLQNIPETNPWDLAISIGVWVLILGSERINRRIPGALIAVILMIVLGYLGVYPSTVSLLGAVPAGLPPLGLPQGVIDSTNIALLLPTALSCFIIILAQSAATSRAYAAKYEDSFNENVDFVGLSVRQPRRGHERARSWSTAARPRPRWSTAPVARRSLPSSSPAGSWPSSSSS